MKKLGFRTVESITQGAEYVEEKSDGRIIFSRFSKQERDTLSYGRDNSFSTAGIRLIFETDSTLLKINTDVKNSNPHGRNFYSFDVYCNNVSIGHIKNFNRGPIYPYKKYALSERHKTFKLPSGIKTVTVYFPWSVQGIIKSIEVDSMAFVRPILKKRKMLMYGDSITQGYDAAFPSHSYASELTDLLGSETVNKGIGGSVFMPKLVKTKGKNPPDIITVAYGTNDWNGSNIADFKSRCLCFFEGLVTNYPNVPIFAITPIWRADCTEKRKFGSFSQVSDIIKEVCRLYKSISFINGIDFLPKNTAYFRDSYLHPNDDGFSFYTKALSREIERYFNNKTV